MESMKEILLFMWKYCRVSPGSGLGNEMEISTENTVQDISSFMEEERNNSFQNKQIQTNCFSVNTTAVQTLSNEVAYKSQSGLWILFF